MSRRVSCTTQQRSAAGEKAIKTARQILTALGQDPDATALLDASVDEDGAQFAIGVGTISVPTNVVLDFLGEPDGTLVGIEFTEATRSAEFTVS